MIEKLIKILQQRNLIETEEQKLIQEMEQSKELIEKNNLERNVQKSEFKEIKKDEINVKNLDELDAKIIDKQNQISKLLNKQYVFIMIYILFLIGSLVGIAISVTIGALTTLSLFETLLVTGAIFSAGFTGMLLSGKLMSKKMGKLKAELEQLHKERKQMIDEVNVEIEELIKNNIKLTNLSDVSIICNNSQEKIEENVQIL